jgi:hypothetical protein
MYGSQHSASSYVNTSQNAQNTTTSRYMPPTQYNYPNSGALNTSTFDRYAHSNKTFTEYKTLQNCPQVQSLAASVAYDNTLSGDKKNNYVYEESEVKRHPDDRLK